MGLQGWEKDLIVPKKCSQVQDFPKYINKFIHLINFIMFQKQKSYLELWLVSIIYQLTQLNI